MELINAEKLVSIIEEHSRNFQGLLPELIKRLIIYSVADLTSIRIPDKNDIWAPGFDGIVECIKGSLYVNSGKSVWEFGSSNDSLKKINSDYDKRTRNSLGIDKNETTYYAVVPKIWAFDNQGCPISSWANDKKDWKEVKLYDASILSDWINQCPVVAAWFFEEIFEDDILEFSTVTKAWNQFSSATSPALSTSMFIRGRDREIQELCECINEKTIIKIKSKTSMDSYGFCLSSFMLSEDLKNSVIVVNDIKSYKRISELCHNKIVLLKPMNIEGFIDNNISIMCYSVEAVSIEPDIQLSPLKKKDFLASLKEMNVNECDLEYYYYHTHGELWALMRMIPGSSNISKPKWAHDPSIKELYPLLFMKNIDINKESDRYICEKLCGKEFESILLVYDDFLKMDDSPIKKSEDIYSIVSSEETWNVLSPNVNGQEIKRLTDTYLYIIDISLGIKTDGYNIRYKASNYIYQLTLNYLYYSYSDFENRILKNHIGRILKRTWESKNIMSTLRLFAEAVPEMVMDLLENDYKSTGSNISQIFNDGGYTSCYIHILSALDVLALNKATKIRACNLLFKMCEIQTSYYWHSTPQESLLNALWLRVEEGSLTLNDKKRLALQYLNNDEIGIGIVFDLLTKESSMRAVRIGSRKREKQPIIEQEFLETVNELSSELIKRILNRNDVTYIVRIIEYYRFFSLEILKSMLDEVKNRDFELINKVRINYTIRRIVYNFRKYKSKSSDYLAIFEAFIKDIEDNNWDENQLHLFFDGYYNCYVIDSPYLKKDNAHMEEDRYTYAYRIDILNKMCSQTESNYLVPLIQIMSDDVNFGYLIGASDFQCRYNEVVKIAIGAKKYILISGFLDKIDANTAYNQIKKLSIDVQKTILSNMHSKEIAGLLEDNDSKLFFWSNKSMYQYSDYEFEQLMKYNPNGLLPYYTVIESQDMSANKSIIMNVLSAIIEKKHNDNTVYQRDKDLINHFIVEMDNNSYYSDEYAVICLNLSRYDYNHRMHNCIKKYYFHHPQLICKLINDNSDDFFNCVEFELYYELPISAFEGFGLLVDFIQTIIDNTDADKKGSAYSLIGELLSRALDKNNTEKNSIIFKIVDNYNNINIDSGFKSGYDSLIHVRFVGDGTDQKAKHDELLQVAEKIEIDYPHSAQLLREISKRYLYNYKTDRISSELGLEVF